jgi:fusion and transport protein UGO1
MYGPLSPCGFVVANSSQRDDSDSEGDESTFFTYHGPETPTPSYSKGSLNERRASPLNSPRPVKKQQAVVPEHYITLKRPDSITEVIGQLWQKDGMFGVWKGSNAAFLYTVLQSLLENWSRSFLSAIFNVPDLGLREDIDRIIDIATPYPWVSLFVAATAAVTTGLVLAPLDLVRTRYGVLLGYLRVTTIANTLQTHHDAKLQGPAPHSGNSSCPSVLHL